MTYSEQVIDSELLALLVCPVDHADLEVKESQLVCTQCGRAYPIEDGIPNMVVESSFEQMFGDKVYLSYDRATFRRDDSTQRPSSARTHRFGAPAE